VNHSAPAVLALVLACLPVRWLGAQAAPASGWYASDQSGMAFEAVSGPAGSEYTLRVSAQEDGQRSELFKNGEAVQSWTRSYGPTGFLAREALEKGGSIREEFLYDAAGRPLLERMFLEDGNVEEIAYTYSSGRLASKTTSFAGAIISTMTYRYAPDGRLALARQTGSEHAVSGFGTSASQKGGSSSWRLVSGGLELRAYDADGRLVSTAVYAGAELISREERTWSEGALRLVVLESADGTKVITEYGTDGAAAGAIVAVSTERDGAVVSTERRSYDDEGRVSRIDYSAGDRSSSVENTYDDEGVLAQAKTSSGGAIVSLVRYESPTVRVEELYDGGVAFARVRYEDGRRVLEEMLRDGVVVRSRRFE